MAAEQLGELMRYTYEYNSYYLRDDGGNILWSGGEVAVCYSVDPNAPITHTVHKHGCPILVEAHMYKMRQQLEKVSMDMALNVRTIRSARWSVEDLNRILDTTGYLSVVIKKLKLEED